MRLAAILGIVLSMAAAACAPRPAATQGAASPSSGTAATPAPGVVSGEVAAQLVAQGARVVDVRTPQEFAAGHVPGAVNIPVDELARRVGEVGDPAEPVILYCRTGRRSGLAAETLRGHGFDKVYDLQRVTDWPAAAQ